MRFALRDLCWSNLLNLLSYEQRLLVLDINTLGDGREEADFVFLLQLIDNVFNVGSRVV